MKSKYFYFIPIILLNIVILFLIKANNNQNKQISELQNEILEVELQNYPYKNYDLVAGSEITYYTSYTSYKENTEMFDSLQDKDFELYTKYNRLLTYLNLEEYFKECSEAGLRPKATSTPAQRHFNLIN